MRDVDDPGPAIHPADLEAIADRLYGTTADMWTVLWGEMCEVPSQELRALLRRRCHIVQDPVSGVWSQPLRPR